MVGDHNSLRVVPRTQLLTECSRVGKAKRAHHSGLRSNWWARRNAPLPTLIWGIVSQGFRTGSGLDFRGERAARGAVRSAARRPGPERGLASENCSSSLHHLISGRTLDPYPHSACLRRGSHQDETHLRTGLVWPLGGTVIIHPTGERGLRRGAPARVRFYAFMVAPSGTSPAVR